MRTSTAQFEVMVEFMERNGDLNKPADGPHGRLTNIRKWEELCAVLNMDTSGTSRPVEKWKKVWSDLKNNTKRKAAKIHRAACGTGGGPASKLVLTDLEQRVLNLMGPQSATGLPSIREVGVDLADTLTLREERVPASISPTLPDVRIHVEDAAGSLDRPGESGTSTPFPAVTLETTVTSPTPHHAQSPQSRRQTRRRYSPLLPEPRRRILRRQENRQRVDAASEQFLASDVEWRNLATEFVTQNARLREHELQQQAQWQVLFAKCLDILERFVNGRRE